jgi:hypothetical protein
MSNFICDKCGKECIDSQNGYVTGCEHYPKDMLVETWQPIETAPRDGTPVDLWHKIGFRQTDTWWDANDECWSSVNDDSDFSHWMPTPKAPDQQYGATSQQEVSMKNIYEILKEHGAYEVYTTANSDINELSLVATKGQLQAAVADYNEQRSDELIASPDKPALSKMSRLYLNSDQQRLLKEIRQTLAETVKTTKTSSEFVIGQIDKLFDSVEKL